MAFGCVCVAYHLLLLKAYRGSTGKRGNWRPWARAFVAGALADGCWWGIGLVSLVGPDRPAEQYVILLAAFIVANGAVPAFGSYLPAFYAVFFPITLTSAVWFFSLGGAIHTATGIGACILIVVMNGLARIANANFNETLRLRFEKDALVDQLRSEKERAEEASLSKSRFLAAASHDLRQPVHALGMYVGALTRCEMSGEARRLVGNIEGSNPRWTACSALCSTFPNSTPALSRRMSGLSRSIPCFSAFARNFPTTQRRRTSPYGPVPAGSACARIPS